MLCISPSNKNLTQVQENKRIKLEEKVFAANLSPAAAPSLTHLLISLILCYREEKVTSAVASGPNHRVFVRKKAQDFHALSPLWSLLLVTVDVNEEIKGAKM